MATDLQAIPPPLAAIHGFLDSMRRSEPWCRLNDAFGVAKAHVDSGRRQATAFVAGIRVPTSSQKRLPERIEFTRNMAFAAVIPGDSIAEQVLTTGFLNFLNLYNSALIVRLVLTWFPNPPQAIENPLSTLCDPYLNLFRGIIPPLGGTLDFSPILAFVVLNLFTNTATALPCETPAAYKSTVWQPVSKQAPQVAATIEQPCAPAAACAPWLHMTKHQEMWNRRVMAQRARIANGNNA